MTCFLRGDDVSALETESISTFKVDFCALFMPTEAGKIVMASWTPTRGLEM